MLDGFLISLQVDTGNRKVIGRSCEVGLQLESAVVVLNGCVGFARVGQGSTESIEQVRILDIE